MESLTLSKQQLALSAVRAPFAIAGGAIALAALYGKGGKIVRFLAIAGPILTITTSTIILARAAMEDWH